MKWIKFLIAGTFFGIIMSKAEIISWYRIYEMFRFESFHMYGVIGSAVILGAVGVAIIKKSGIKSIYGEKINFPPKDNTFFRYIFGGTIFGLGWAMTGACPGPLFVLLGKGIWSILVVIFGAILGTFLYGLVLKKLPH